MGSEDTTTTETTSDVPTTTVQQDTTTTAEITTTETPTTTENPANFPKEGGKHVSNGGGHVGHLARAGGDDGEGYRPQRPHAPLVLNHQRPKHRRHLGPAVCEVE